MGEADLLLIGDCASVVAQVSGARCGAAAAAYRDRILAMLPPGTQLRVRHVKRSQNLAGIALAKLHG